MQNMPPKEMWILCHGTTSRYYRTKTQIKSIVNSTSVASRYDAIWYYDFTSDNPHWKKLTKEELLETYK